MIRFRHLRLRAETSIGSFGVDIPLKAGLNVIWANNTMGKSTCLQGLLYALGLERMLSPRREIPLTYVMTKHLFDSETGQTHEVLESSVWVEIENDKGSIITIRRGVITTSTDRKLISVFEGPLLTQPANHYRQRDYFVLDPGAAQRETGFHNMLARFIGWSLPNVRRYDGRETKLYMETIFPLLFVEQKAGWSSIPAAFPTYFQIRDVGQRAVEFLLALETHALELKRQQLELDLAASKAAWEVKRKEILVIAELVNAQVEGISLTPMLSVKEIERASLLVAKSTGWHYLDEVTSELRSRIIELSKTEIPIVEDMTSEAENEIEKLTEKIAELNLQRNSLLRAHQVETAQMHSVEQRLAALEEDLQKNIDAQKLRDLGSAIAETFAAEHCPTCAQPISDTLLAQRVGTMVMSIEDNIEYIKGQRDIFKGLRNRAESTISSINKKLAALTAEINVISSRLRALKADLIAPSRNPSVAALEERIRIETQLKALEDVQHRFETQKIALIRLATEHANLMAQRNNLPADRLTESDKSKISRLRDLIQDQLNNYGFRTFLPAELDISMDNYRPQKEGFEIGFELSASDAIRLKWAYQLALLEVSRSIKTNHPGFVIFDEPRQQETARISFRHLLERAATAGAAGQQIIFATSEDRRQLVEILSHIECNLLMFNDRIIQKVKS